ncbi:hypothetical protein MRBLMA1_001252 [Sphingobium sp. LMA1-1-1.1]|uniref:hypothetical protein n=1 Tax=Sphingobium sp. LMA1-1-1.1 TaxID=3135238 RepID=UPI0034236E06
MPDPGAGGISSGEVGGVLAGVIAVGMALGKGMAWLLNWRDARAKTRAAKLQVWHDELKAREDALDRKIDARLASFEQQVDKWRLAFHLVAAELLQRYPQSMALMQAQKILAEAFPIHLAVPEDMARSLDRLDEAEAGKP